MLGKLEQTADLGNEHITHFDWAGEEELLSHIGMVKSPTSKVLVKFSFESDGVLREENAVHIETKRDRRVTKPT